MRAKQSTAERGYGHAHRKERKAWLPIVNAGRASCARCGWPIPPKGYGPCPRCGKNHRGWDLDHNQERTGYIGASHVCCNRATAGRRASSAAQGLKRALRRVTREW